ncbi:hypothetical protein PQE75_gp047 [Bacillus phage vB_BcoS-136]|uniref:Uncharacterized protein n=1 Tax=Bacillus phage vB_BcoS-136 TaxID=2419619 RepID=A0A3G3BVA9_9CAUD|nr:hypothetical protein PQE75_gp047 [Bacillus phage vB_BcoS-136]AYP68179.1 hypothetical protein vBBcoS136_00047 [Bacillus phage vB_BcoS-136]
MSKIHTLTQDNGGCNNFEKRTVKISDSNLTFELKRFFGWRKDVNADRMYKLGSSDYDKFIKYLSENGY